MITNLTVADLIAFEEDIAEVYKTGVITGPIHLRGGNEQQLIDIYQDIRQQDIVLATWANHLEALLKGIPADVVKKRILAGHSMAMNFQNYNFYTSAIVNGISPIGVGMAWAAKKLKKDQRVYIFIGDMAFQSGDTIECINYSVNFNLPVTWVVCDNEISVDTLTVKAWNGQIRNKVKAIEEEIYYRADNVDIKYYSYKNKFSHSGVGAFVSF